MEPHAPANSLKTPLDATKTKQETNPAFSAASSITPLGEQPA